MTHCNTILAQILKSIPRHEFEHFANSTIQTVHFVNIGRQRLREKIVLVLNGSIIGLPICLKSTLKNLFDRLDRTAEELSIIGKIKAELVRGVEPYKRLLDLESVGEAYSAMLSSSLGNGSEFKT